MTEDRRKRRETMGLTVPGTDPQVAHSGTLKRQNGHMSMWYKANATGSSSEYSYFDQKNVKKAGFKITGTTITEKEYREILDRLKK